MKSQDISLQKRVIMNKTGKHFCLANKIFKMLGNPGKGQRTKDLFTKRWDTWMLSLSSFPSLKFCTLQMAQVRPSRCFG